MVVALYIRVSSEEQVLHGYSIEAQENALLQYAEDNNYIVYNTYKDEGISARKPYTKRPEMLRLLQDAKSRKFDTVLFCKLDRWFRNIKEYFKVQDILEASDVKWKAILEDYNTITADGRLKVNIMLSVAENEADRTSERIKFVQKEKIARGETITTLPYGYKLQDKKPVKDEELAPIIEYMFEHYLTYRSAIQLAKDINAKFNLDYGSKTWSRRLKNPAYKGTMYGIDNFCEPYITPYQYNEVLKIKAEKAVKNTPTGRIALFSGLLRCPICGYRMSAAWFKRPNSDYQLATYRCNNALNQNKCPNRHVVYESKIERFLLAQFPLQAKEKIAVAKIEQKQTPVIDVTKLDKKLQRLTDVYIMGNMEKKEYERRSAQIKAEIAEATKVLKPIEEEKVEEAIDTIFNLYSNLDRKAKQIFWGSLLENIETDGIEVVGFKLK